MAQVSKGSPCPLQLLGQLERAVLQHAFAEEWHLMQVRLTLACPIFCPNSFYSANKHAVKAAKGAA